MSVIRTPMLSDKYALLVSILRSNVSHRYWYVLHDGFGRAIYITFQNVTFSGTFNIYTVIQKGLLFSYDIELNPIRSVLPPYDLVYYFEI